MRPLAAQKAGESTTVVPGPCRVRGGWARNSCFERLTFVAVPQSRSSFRPELIIQVLVLAVQKTLNVAEHLFASCKREQISVMEFATAACSGQGRPPILHRSTNSNIVAFTDTAREGKNESNCGLFDSPPPRQARHPFQVEDRKIFLCYNLDYPAS